VLRNLKRWEEALADVEQLLALETTAGDVRLRGELLLELGQKDAAEQELRRAVPTGW
jgi:regulator of sirC expression with transglutaminase-like and TPR domain